MDEIIERLQERLAVLEDEQVILRGNLEAQVESINALAGSVQKLVDKFEGRSVLRQPETIRIRL